MSGALLDDRLERRLRRAVAGAARADPALRAERRRRRWAGPWPLLMALRAAHPLAWWLLWWLGGELPVDPDAPKVIVAQLSFISAIVAGVLLGIRKERVSQMVLAHLPLSGAGLLRERVRGMLPPTRWLEVDLVIGGLLAAGAWVIGDTVRAVGILWLVIHLLAAVGLVAWLVVVVERLGKAVVWPVLAVAALVGGEIVRRVLAGAEGEQVVIAAFYATPAGIVQTVLAPTRAGTPSDVAQLALLLLAATAALVLGWRVLFRRFTIPAPAGIDEGPPAATRKQAAPRSRHVATEDPAVAVLEARARAAWRATVRAPGWSLRAHGLAGRLTLRLLPQRLWGAVDALGPGAPVGRSWVQGLLVLLSAHLLASIWMATGHGTWLPPAHAAGAHAAFRFILCWALVAALLSLLQLVGGRWHALHSSGGAGAAGATSIAWPALAPVDIGLLVRAYLTVQAVRLLLNLPLIVSGMGVTLWWTPLDGATVPVVLGYALLALWAMLVAQPLVLLLHLFTLTGSKGIVSGYDVGRVAAVLATVLAVVQLTSGAESGRPATLIPCAVVLPALIAVLLWAQRLAYRRGWCDLVNVAKRPA